MEPLLSGDALRKALDGPRTRNLEAIVVRLGKGRHDTPPTGRLTRVEGLVGDRWSARPQANQDRQLTLMDARVIRMLLAQRPSDAEPAGLDLPGDNLVIDLSTAEHVLAPGTRLRIGAALIEINAVPHTGCGTFASRFGQDALAWVNREEEMDLHLRGIHAEVVEDGDIAVGDEVTFTVRTDQGSQG